MNKMKLEFGSSCLNRILKHGLKLVFLFVFMLYVPVASALYDYLLWGMTSSLLGGYQLFRFIN